MNDYILLYKPLTPVQLAAIIESDWQRFIPDYSQQKFFYAKINRRYAELIARIWSAPKYSAGYVAEFMISTEWIKQFEIQSIAYEEQMEYRIPIEYLEELNINLLCPIDIISAFHYSTAPFIDLHEQVSYQSFQ